MSLRLTLAASLASTLVLSASFGAQLTLSILPLPSPAPLLLALNAILLGFGIWAVWRTVVLMIDEANVVVRLDMDLMVKVDHPDGLRQPGWRVDIRGRKDGA